VGRVDHDQFSCLLSVFWNRVLILFEWRLLVKNISLNFSRSVRVDPPPGQETFGKRVLVPACASVCLPLFWQVHLKDDQPEIFLLTGFVRESFCGDARPLQFHAACQCLGKRRHLGSQTFAQRLDSGQ
jgi:hypothetical protein